MVKFEVIVEDYSAGKGTTEDPCRRGYKYHELSKMNNNQPSCPFLIADVYAGKLIYLGTAYMATEALIKCGWKPPRA